MRVFWRWLTSFCKIDKYINIKKKFTLFWVFPLTWKCPVWLYYYLINITIFYLQTTRATLRTYVIVQVLCLSMIMQNDNDYQQTIDLLSTDRLPTDIIIICPWSVPQKRFCFHSWHYFQRLSVIYRHLQKVFFTLKQNILTLVC